MNLKTWRYSFFKSLALAVSTNEGRWWVLYAVKLCFIPLGMGFLSVSELCGVYLSQSPTILDRMADLAQKKNCLVSHDILFERKYHMLLL